VATAWLVDGDVCWLGPLEKSEKSRQCVQLLRYPILRNRTPEAGKANRLGFSGSELSTVIGASCSLSSFSCSLGCSPPDRLLPLISDVLVYVQMPCGRDDAPNVTFVAQHVRKSRSAEDYTHVRRLG